MAKLTLKDHVRIAARAHSDLNIFYAVIAIMEGGCVYGSPGSQQAADQIIQICKCVVQRNLRTHDDAVDAAGRLALREPPQ